MSHRSSAHLLRAVVFLLVAGESLARAQPAPTYRRPVGVYAHVSIEDAINSYPCKGKPTSSQLHTCLRGLYRGLLANPAIAGLEAGRHWDNIQLADPICNHRPIPSCPPDAWDGYDWSYLDDVFVEAQAARKTVQLIITPGVSSPSWLFARIPSCDGLFTGKGAPRDCGWATFYSFPESQRADSHRQPMPWNSVYSAAWVNFLIQLEARYGSNPAFVAIAVAGPVTASDEFILPTTAKGSSIHPPHRQPVPADIAWQKLIAKAFPSVARYQNTDEAIVDAWESTIDEYELIFSHVTLFLGPDAGNDWPNPPGPLHTPTDQSLYETECSANPSMSCAAKTEVIQYFLEASGPNGKATQVGGMTAGSRTKPGDIGVAGMKVLTGLTPSPPLPPIQGGAEFDYPVSTGKTIWQQDCPDWTQTNQKPSDCLHPTAEEGALATFKVFFTDTLAAGDFGADPGPAPVRVQYVGIAHTDVVFAMTEPHPPSPSLQDLLELANRDLFEMAGEPPP